MTGRKLSQVFWDLTMGFPFCRTAAEIQSRGRVSRQRCVADWDLPACTVIPGLHDPDGMALMASSLAGTITRVCSFR
jgi:hypothetical protein